MGAALPQRGTGGGEKESSLFLPLHIQVSRQRQKQTDCLQFLALWQRVAAALRMRFGAANPSIQGGTNHTAIVAAAVSKCEQPEVVAILDNGTELHHS